MTDNPLPALAQTLKHADGKPDILARRSVSYSRQCICENGPRLDDLVDNALSNREIRYLRDRLNAIPLNYDILMHLPNELLLCVVPLLGLDGFLTARMVSRAWNQRFSSPEICISIIKLHFRSTWEGSYNSVRGDAQELAKLTLCKWLPRAAVKRVKRQYGTYSILSRRAYKAHGQGTINIAAVSDHTQYNNGRISYSLGAYSICVQSLIHEDSTQFFMDPDREYIEEWVLSDRFLITQTSSSKLALKAYDFELSPAGNVRLPNRVMYMSAYRNRVGLITLAAEVLVWHIRGALKQLDTSQVQEMVAGFDHWETYGVLLHPVDKDLTFVMCLAWTDARPDGDVHKYAVRLIIQEFIKESSRDIHYIDTTYTVEPPAPPRRDWTPYFVSESDSRQITFEFQVKIVVNPDGLCGMWRDLSYAGRIGSPFSQESFVTFDMYTKKFDTSCPPPGVPQGVTVTVHGQAIDMHFKRQRERPDSYSVEHPDGNFLYGSAEGDDDFVVLFGHKGYAVAIP